jgi:hypothetical protein
VGTEVDPTFTASPAGGITAANIGSWNSKVGTEVDPTFQVSPAKNITAANITSWNNKVAVEVDPTFTASPAAGITSSNITTWNTDLDRSPTNEIQTLTVGNDSLRISLGNKVPLPKGTQWTPWNATGIRYRNVFLDTALNASTFTNPVRQEIYLERINRSGVNMGALSRMHNADVGRNFYGLSTGGNNTAIFTAQSTDPALLGRGFQAFVSSQPTTNTASNTGFYGQVNGANEVIGADLVSSDGQFVTGIRSAASSLRSGARVIGLESTVESGDSNVAVVAKALGTTGKRVGLFATTSGVGSSDFAAVFQGKTLVKNDLLYLQNPLTNFNGIEFRSAPGQNNMFMGMVPTAQGPVFAVADFLNGGFNMPFIIERGARNKFVEVRSWNQLHVGSSPSYSMDLLEVTDTTGAPVGGTRAAANFRVYGKRGINRGLIGVSQGISTGENVGAELWTSDGAAGNVGVRSNIWPNTAGDYFNLAVVGITNNSSGATGRGVAGFAYGTGYGLGAWGEAATQGENWGTTGIALAEAGNNFLQIGVNGLARGSYGSGGTGGGTYIAGYFRAYGLNANYGSFSKAFSVPAGNTAAYNVGVVAEAGPIPGQAASLGTHLGMRAWANGAGTFNAGLAGYAAASQNGQYNIGGDFWGNSQRSDGAAYGLQAFAEGTAPEKIGGWLEASGANTNYGVYAKASGGTTNHAGYFEGNVTITGNLNVTGNLAKGGGTFKIDHPLDPANKYLVHSFVESPEMLNVYSGNTVTDAAGRSVVTLPDYFSAANADIRYQLTVVGATFAQAIVGEEIKGNAFVVLTNQPNVKVSWQVTAVRNDAYAKANRIQPEVEKSAAERGGYLHPELFGSERSVYPTVVKPVNPMDRNAPAPAEGGRE